MIKKLGLFGSGILYGLSYPLSLDIPSGILAWVALVPMLLAMRDAPSFKVFFFRTYPILFIGTYIFGAFVFSFGVVAGFVTCFSQFALTYLPLIVHYFIQKKWGWRQALWLLPLVWTVGDWVQHLIPHSFQISSLAYTQTTVLWLAQYADIFGMWGITFWVMTVNVSIALTIDSVSKFRGDSKSPRDNPLSIFFKEWTFHAVLLFGLPLLYAFGSQLQLPNGRSIKVAIKNLELIRNLYFSFRE